MIIRNETVSDIEAIAEVTRAAFRTLPISHHTEQFIINALRAANALTLSLVAEIDGRVACVGGTFSIYCCSTREWDRIEKEPRVHRDTKE